MTFQKTKEMAQSSIKGSEIHYSEVTRTSGHQTSTSTVRFSGVVSTKTESFTFPPPPSFVSTSFFIPQEIGC